MIELQTASAAGSAGYNRAGGIYVKAGDKTAGVVHAYTFFDTKSAINEALAAAGFSEKGGDELVDFLKNKSDTEVNAYFKMQQTALSLAFEKVAGKGSGVERETSRDERIIGKFGKWAGKQQDSSTANQLVTHGGPGAEAAKAQQAGDFLSFIALSGFGELGETGLRPSAVGPGFYVELELSNRFFGQEMARQQMKGMGTLDPVTTFVNQYNPVAMMAQATQNVRLATLSGKSESYMWEAQALNMAKAPIVATGSLIVAMGAEVAIAGGPMAPIGAALAAAGGIVMMAGNSINVNPTTGERIMKATDQSLIATVAGGITAFFGGSQIISGAGTVLAAGASSLVQSSVRYDSDGRSQGMSLTSWKGDHHAERAVLNATTAMITSAGGQYAQRNAAVGTDSFMGNAIWGDLISTGTNVLGEYGAQQTWGRQHSNYDALTRPDSGRLGSLAGAIVTAQEQDRQAGEKLAALEAKQTAEIAQADKLAREGQKQQAIAILMAGGYFKDRRDAEAYVAKVKAQAEGLPEGELVKDAKGNFYVRDKDGFLYPLSDGLQSLAPGEWSIDLAHGPKDPTRMSDVGPVVSLQAHVLNQMIQNAKPGTVLYVDEHGLKHVVVEVGSGHKILRSFLPGERISAPAEGPRVPIGGLPLDNPVYREDLYRRIQMTSQDIRGLQIAARGRVDMQPVIDGILRQRFTAAEIKIYNQVAPKLNSGATNWERVGSGFEKTFYDLAKLGSHIVTGSKYALGAGSGQSYSEYYDSDPRNTYIAEQILRLEARHRLVHETLLLGDDYEKSMIEARAAGMDYLHGEMGAEGMILIGSLGVEGAVSRVVTRTLARAALGGLAALTAGERKLVEKALARAKTATEREKILDIFRHQLRSPPQVAPVDAWSAAWRQSEASSKALAENLGLPAKSGLDAHHIVPGEIKRAQYARDLLERYQIDINAAENGVALVGGEGQAKSFLPRHHRKPANLKEASLHNRAGIDALNKRLQKAVEGIADWATARRALIEELGKIRRDIIFGGFP